MENWLPQVRAESFKEVVLPCFESIQIPINYIIDKEIDDLLKLG